MRRFVLNRKADLTGMSGTGDVAEGVEFEDGTCAMRWKELPTDDPNYIRGVRATTVIYQNAASIEALHGHGGFTVVHWVD